jgi:hypothetical protein
MLPKDSYNIDRGFDYVTLKNIVIESLEKIAKEEPLKKKVNVTYDCGRNPNIVVQPIQPTPLLTLKIRNTTEYVLKRGNFTCRLCHVSVRDNKTLKVSDAMVVL